MMASILIYKLKASFFWNSFLRLLVSSDPVSRNMNRAARCYVIHRGPVLETRSDRHPDKN